MLESPNLEAKGQDSRRVPRPAPRLPSLDGWRAIAITFVLLAHASDAKNSIELSRILDPLSSQGEFGVRIFFALSGFLITLILIEEYKHAGSINLGNFYIRRILRIFPVYYLFLFVLASLQTAGLYHDSSASWIGSLTFTRNMLGRGDSASTHLWSLAVEEQFYLVWPATLVVLNLCARWRLAIAILLAIAALSFAIRLIDCHQDTFVCLRILGQRSALRFADSLAVGCIGAFLLSNVRVDIERRAKTGILYAATAILALTPAITATSNVAGSALVLLQAVLTITCLTLSISANTTVLFAILNSRALTTLGLISYSLYVWHMLFLANFVGPKLSNNILYDGRVWWMVAIVVATGSYFWFERPITQLKNRLQRPAPSQLKT